MAAVGTLTEVDVVGRRGHRPGRRAGLDFGALEIEALLIETATDRHLVRRRIDRHAANVVREFGLEPGHRAHVRDTFTANEFFPEIMDDWPKLPG